MAQKQTELFLYSTLLNGLDDSMYIIDMNGDTVLYNNATLKLYQCSKEQFDRKYSNMYQMAADGIFDRNLFTQVMETKQPAEGWLELIDINGNKRLYYVTDYPVLGADGNVKYVVGITRSREKIEKEHISAQKGLENIITGTLTSEGQSKKEFIYRGYTMTAFVTGLSKVAPRDVPILLQGETGTGKEVLANYIHDHSNRRDHPMIAINCAAISPSLFEAEMFGYAKGAFTGSNPKGKIGLIEKANHSTLFLDEIDSMPLEQQGKLLRALETKTIYRLGESDPVSVDFRLVAATNKNMQRVIWEGRFREDLYYRLNVIPAIIPPLRSRREDIRPLAEYYLSWYCTKYSIHKRFSENVYQQLESYDWPGNVRELKNLVERTLLMSDSEVEEINMINLPTRAEGRMAAVENPVPVPSVPVPEPVRMAVAPQPPVPEVDSQSTQLEDRMGNYEKAVLRDALNRCNSYNEAAAYLGISVSTMYRKTAKYNLEKDFDFDKG